ncbi:GNAT family N-acetyltransferase [Nocardioides sp. cx-173]|uniref:GNAT family N-acetyltransferase n=1 Tax=Nocardioides sp. cx-173 TaxID=2898796 RepID=UPI001E2B5D13|nr:GNAT family N-acetyltransferase [Nocardioides sp. cx-173]MCD4525602.1 GNAT family N-acetyltransferase [Nocardioides sp. cx-173]UGB42746.1 GNAT family N-acetyltransferase [Nocardioides sp. cx-173]
MSEGTVGRHTLGPHVVGQRVVVRRVVRGETGPSGGPALTDLLGVCTAWGDDACVIQPQTGAPVRIPLADIVSGKPVPPRPSVRQRVPPAEAQRRGFALFADLETRPLGGWVLRRSPTATARRANSVLAFGPAGVPDAYAEVVAFYDAHGTRPIAAVLPGSEEEALFRDHGWGLESHDADTVFQLAAVSQASRSLRGVRADGVEVALDVAGDQATVRLLLDGEQVGGGVAAYAGDWVGFRSLEVAPAHRRRGLALVVMAELLDWGAERGATTAYLQVLGDNEPALALYARLGFREHHRYRYLAP